MKKATWLSPDAFDPAEHVAELANVITSIESAPALDDSTLHGILAKHPKHGRSMFSKSELLRGARHLAERHLWQGDFEALIGKIQVKPIRTQSGVTPVTVLTEPWPCPGRCIFCPNDPAMPKSYLSKEPGAQRAEQHRFDPYAQVTSRLTRLDEMGHGTSKIELIILGGTWSSYPRAYQLWFVLRLFHALNDFSPTVVTGSNRQSPERSATDAWRGRPSVELEAELTASHRQNERAQCRSVGLTVETRPDHVSESETRRIRALGATRVQLGYQSLDDRVLELNDRGHSVADSATATERLRLSAFKVQAHWMPNLYGSSREEDLADFERLFADPRFRPDELKIYPCQLVQGTLLEARYRSGDWHPYTKDELLELLGDCLVRVPEYCRVSRVVRDIPGQDLVVGERVNGLRDAVVAELARKGLTSRDVRAREIRTRTAEPATLILDEVAYETSVSDERFLQFVTPDHDLAGFLRLTLPRRAPALVELRQSALIREVHVYGTAVSVGERDARRSQHSGLGTRLVARARELARDAGFRDLAVISAVGTRDYYRKLGFEDGELYQHAAL